MATSNAKKGGVRKHGRGMAVLFAFWVADMFFYDPSETGGSIVGLAGPLFGTLAFVPLLWRHKRPLSVYATCVVIASVLHVVFVGYRPMFAVWVGLYAVAQVESWRWIALATLVTGIPGVLFAADEVASLANDDRGLVSALVVLSGLEIIAMFVVLAGRRQGSNHRKFNDLLGRQTQGKRKAVLDERARIARELHDIVAHSVSLMSLQASGAARMLDADPERSRELLVQVVELGESAVSELHRMLGLLETVESDIDIEALEALNRLDELVEGFERAGLLVKVSTNGSPAGLDISIGHACYRVVQEALTNALKHGPAGGLVAINLDWAKTEFHIEVSNAVGSRDRRAGTGRGLRGLEERVTMLGGSFTTEKTDDRFVVTAVLPVQKVTSPDFVSPKLQGTGSFDG